MEKIIKLDSHDGSNNYLKKLNITAFQRKQAYVLVSQHNTVRTGKVEEDKNFIDPSGGPMLIEGSRVKTYKIIKITHVPYVGFILILEKDDISSN